MQIMETDEKIIINVDSKFCISSMAVYAEIAQLHLAYDKYINVFTSIYYFVREILICFVSVFFPTHHSDFYLLW